jgi:hypothetical protein
VKRAFKLVLILIVLFVVTTATVSAADRGSLRLGLEFFGGTNVSTAVLIIRPAPFDIKVGYNFAQDNRAVYLSGDYRIISGYQLIEFLHLFLSVGAYVQIAGDPDPFLAGLHVPVGLQVFLIDNVVEIFVELTPKIGLWPEPTFDPWRGGVGFTVLIPKFWK